MLVIPICLWPHGEWTKSRVLSQVAIGNDGSGNEEVGNYNVWALSRSDNAYDCTRRLPDARVEEFDRSRGHLALLCEALKALAP